MRDMPALINIVGGDGHIGQQVLLRLLKSVWHHWQMTLLKGGPDEHPEEAVIGFCALPCSLVLCWQVREQSSAQ